MTEVIPAFLINSHKELYEKLSRFVNVVSMVQIDVCDGNFVNSVSWPMHEEDKSSVLAILDEEEGLPFWDSFDFEFDLMILNAHKQFDFFVSLGAKRIVFHLEAENESDFKEFLEGLDLYMKENVSIGLSINTTTPVEKLAPFINLVDFVQCMGIKNVGYQGEPFDENVLIQIKDLRTKYPELIISVDGSVNEETAPALVKAGANRLIIGSALDRSYDIRETIKKFANL